MEHAGNYAINMKINYVELSDVGLKRTNNEDALLVCQNDFGDYLFLVADGMGGHNAGEIASEMAVKLLKNAFLEIKDPEIDYREFLEYIITEINKEIYKSSLLEIKYNNMGTTCSAMIIKNNRIFIGHVGDSRIYFIANNKIKLLTKDHTLVQAMLDAETITQQEAQSSKYKNILLQALGTAQTITMQTLTAKIPEECQFVLCSDGLTGDVSDEEILTIMSKNIDETEKAEELIELAKMRGGHDNISVITVEKGGK